VPGPDDPFQHAVYAAEDASLPGGGRQFSAMADLRRWVEQVVTSPWWSETFPSAPVDVDVVARSATSTASVSHVGDAGRAAFVRVHPSHRHAAGVVHELAHVAAWEPMGHLASVVEPSHGPRFCEALLLLWREHLGVHAYGALRSAFDDQGIPYRRARLDRSAP
jgi:putative metallohydrolase (TIGR04338 family)